MILGRRLLAAGLFGAALLGAWLAALPARAQEGEIRIGEVDSYSALPSFTEPYRKGWQLAVDEINIAGGIGGKKLTVLSKDDAGKPAEALAAATELVARDHVACWPADIPPPSDWPCRISRGSIESSIWPASP